MGKKKKNWFDRLKRLFSSDAKSKQEKKEKRKRWAFGKFKSKCLPVLPPAALVQSRSVREAEHEQSKHAVAVTVATAVAAEAAVTAAQAAAQVVRLTGTPPYYHCAQEAAATKLQTAFRGYLARSALKALRGLVKLQALIRGQAVRRQTSNTLKGLQSLMKIQTQARASRVRALMDYQVHDFNDIWYGKIRSPDVTKAALQQNTGKNWDSSPISQDKKLALLINRKEAAIKRERAIEYASSYQDRRRPTTPVSLKFDPDGEVRRWSWLDEWVGAQPLDKHIPQVVLTPCRDRSTRAKLEESKLRYLARRSFNRSRRASVIDDDSFASSPSFPGYMASTASANSRFRSLSTPKQRLGSIDPCSEYCAPFTDRLLSPLPSVASEAVATKAGSNVQKSPRPKSRGGTAECRRSPNYLNFDSECTLLNWDRRQAFR